VALITLFADNPSTTTTSSSGTTAPAALTTETWTVTSSATFPVAATGVSQFHIADPALPAEIIAVTNVSGTTWSVTRGTTPIAHATGATFYQVVSAGDLTSLAPKDTPALTGTPTAPTATALTSSAQLATTAYADSAVGVENSRATTVEVLKAPLASPALTGSPTAPTQTTGDSSTKLATDAFVATAVATETTRATTAEALALPLSGGTMTGAIAMGSHKVTGLANGSVSSDAAAYGQIPTALLATFTYGSTGAVPSSGTWTAGAVAVDQNSIVRVCTASGTPGTWQRDGASPWQFWVDDYGAKGDGRIVGDGAMTSATANLTSATANFTSGDAGKNIVVNGALGSSNAPLYTTILSVTNSTTAVLSANATNTVTAAAVFWASDDSAAIVNAISAAKTYAQANTFKAQVLFQARSYGLATLTTTTAGGSLADQNTLVPIPYPNVNGTTQKLSFELIGAGENADQQYFDSTIPCMSGTCLVATVAASGTNPSIIGGPYDSTNLSGTWANTKGVIKGISVWAGFNPGWIAYGLNQLASCWVDNCCANVLAPQAAGQLPIATSIPANGSGVGMWMAANNDCGAGRFLEMGYYKGVNLSTRNTIEKLFTSASVHGAFVQTVNSNVIHSARIGYWACQGVTNGITSTGTSGTMGLVVDMYDSTSTVTTDLNDPHGTLVGSVNWYHDVSTAPTVVAGFAMKITNLRQPPGYWSGAPSVPASATAQQNTAWRDAYVIVTGGTVSDITVDGHSTGLTSGMVIVPSGKTITMTYSVAPTWNWWLL